LCLEWVIPCADVLLVLSIHFVILPVSRV
jgi:hypothetical protein